MRNTYVVLFDLGQYFVHIVDGAGNVFDRIGPMPNLETALGVINTSTGKPVIVAIRNPSELP